MKIKKELVTQRHSKAPISEMFRNLRTNIQYMINNKNMKTLLITSTSAGEGKSWVASNLAVTFAQSGKQVLLIDADMRRGRQYTIFRVPPKPGLSNYLMKIDEGETRKIILEDYIKPTDVRRLYLMPTGNIPVNPSELLVASKVAELLEKLKEKYDVIIIDGTPCELVTDSVILSSVVDSTVVVAEYKSTKKDRLERIIKNIKNVGGNLIGIVINKFPVSKKDYSQGYYYDDEENEKFERYAKNRKEKKVKDSKNETKIVFTREEYEKEKEKEIAEKEAEEKAQEEIAESKEIAENKKSEQKKEKKGKTNKKTEKSDEQEANENKEEKIEKVEIPENAEKSDEKNQEEKELEQLEEDKKKLEEIREKVNKLEKTREKTKEKVKKSEEKKAARSKKTDKSKKTTTKKNDKSKKTEDKN